MSLPSLREFRHGHDEPEAADRGGVHPDASTATAAGYQQVSPQIYPFNNAATDYPHHEQSQATVAHHRDGFLAYFGQLLQALNPPEALIVALVRVTDGAMTPAHIQRPMKR